MATTETKTAASESNVTKLPSRSKSKRTTKSRAKKATTTRAATTATKTVRKAKTAARRTTNKAVRQTADYAKTAIDTATRAATASKPADAMKNWTSLFQQPQSFLSQSPFKMESIMNNASFPQFDQFQAQAQSAANQYTTLMTKTQAAAEKSRTRLTSGVQECSSTLTKMLENSMQRNNEAMRSLMTCKSLNEFADLQNRLLKQNLEATTSECAKLIEQVTKCVSSASEPLSDLASTAMAQTKKSFAA